MTHCTANIGWYIGKFVLSISAILFIYWGFLKEKEIECYCGAIERKSQREASKVDKEKFQGRCICRYRRGTTFACGCERDTNKKPVGGHAELNSSKNSDNEEEDHACSCSKR